MIDMNVAMECMGAMVVILDATHFAVVCALMFESKKKLLANEEDKNLPCSGEGKTERNESYTVIWVQ